MLYEHRTYRVTPGTAPQFLKIYEEKCFPIISQYATPVGSWVTDAGTLNAVVFIWAYDDYGHRSQQRAKLGADPAWQAAVKEILPFLVHQESMFLMPTAFSPLK